MFAASGFSIVKVSGGGSIVERIAAFDCSGRGEAASRLRVWPLLGSEVTGFWLSLGEVDASRISELRGVGGFPSGGANQERTAPSNRMVETTAVAIRRIRPTLLVPSWIPLALRAPIADRAPGKKVRDHNSSNRNSPIRQSSWRNATARAAIPLPLCLPVKL